MINISIIINSEDNFLQYNNQEPGLIGDNDTSSEGTNEKYKLLIEQMNNQETETFTIKINYICSIKYAITNKLNNVDYIFFVSPTCSYGSYYILDNILTYKYFKTNDLYPYIIGKMSYHTVDKQNKKNHVHKYCDNLYVNYTDLNPNTIVLKYNENLFNLILHNQIKDLHSISCYSCDYFNFIQNIT